MFGRGGEEALALAAAGIRFEIVPGVSSAIAAGALAAIPVTHRGIAAGFVVVSGHAEEAYRPILESLAPHSATVVVMMGIGHVSEIATLLVERGWNAHTPVGMVFGASTPSTSVWTLTLRELQHGVELPADGQPGTVIVGEVVRLRAALVAADPNLASGFSRTGTES